VHVKSKNLERFIVCSKAYAWNILQPNWKSSANKQTNNIRKSENTFKKHYIR